MRKYTFCCNNGCGIPIIGDRVDWASPICVGCPLPKAPLTRLQRLFKKG